MYAMKIINNISGQNRFSHTISHQNQTTFESNSIVSALFSTFGVTPGAPKPGKCCLPQLCRILSVCAVWPHDRTAHSWRLLRGPPGQPSTSLAASDHAPGLLWHRRDHRMLGGKEHLTVDKHMWLNNAGTYTHTHMVTVKARVVVVCRKNDFGHQVVGLIKPSYVCHRMQIRALWGNCEPRKFNWTDWLEWSTIRCKVLSFALSLNLCSVPLRFNANRISGDRKVASTSSSLEWDFEKYIIVNRIEELFIILCVKLLANKNEQKKPMWLVALQCSWESIYSEANLQRWWYQVLLPITYIEAQNSYMRFASLSVSPIRQYCPLLVDPQLQLITFHSRISAQWLSVRSVTVSTLQIVQHIPGKRKCCWNMLRIRRWANAIV